MPLCPTVHSYLLLFYYSGIFCLVADVCDPDSLHEFGLVGRQPAGRSVQGGWLCSETLVELKLYERAIHLWRRKHQDKDLTVKLTPVDVDVALGRQHGPPSSVPLHHGGGMEMMEESVDVAEFRERKKGWPAITVAVSAENE